MQPYDRVKIRAPKHKLRPLTGLDAAFEGQLGTVREIEMDGRTRMYRVRLDTPVSIEIGNGGATVVTDDLWSGEYLRRTVR